MEGKNMKYVVIFKNCFLRHIDIPFSFFLMSM